MTKEEIYQLLDEKNISYEIINHKPVYTMEDLDSIKLPHTNLDAKNILVRDDKKQDFYLITIRGEKRVNLKEFRKVYQTRPLSFASPFELEEYLKLTPGSVTPFGLLNDKDKKVKFFLDKDFLNYPGIIGVHPNENTATIFLKTEDLIKILKKNGHEVKLMEAIE